MIKRFLRSVKYALQGLALGIKEERNVRIDITAMLLVLRFALFYDFDKTDWAVVIIIVFLIPALELLNTAVERAVFKPDTEHYMPAGAAKDAAAGGVFVMSIGAVIVGRLMFWNVAVFRKIWLYYTGNLLRAAALLCFIIIAYLFITKDNFEKRN